MILSQRVKWWFSSPAVDSEKEECDIVYSGTFLYITYVDYFVYNMYFYMQSNQRSSDVSTVPWGQKYHVTKSNNWYMDVSGYVIL